MAKLVFTFIWWAMFLLFLATVSPVVLFGGGFALAVILLVVLAWALLSLVF